MAFSLLNSTLCPFHGSGLWPLPFGVSAYASSLILRCLPSSPSLLTLLFPFLSTTFITLFKIVLTGLYTLRCFLLDFTKLCYWLWVKFFEMFTLKKFASNSLPLMSPSYNPLIIWSLDRENHQSLRWCWHFWIHLIHSSKMSEFESNSSILSVWDRVSLLAPDFSCDPLSELTMVGMRVRWQWFVKAVRKDWVE